MPIALATPFTFTLSGASTVLSDIGETITGSFAFDAATHTESAVSITLSREAPYSGTYATDPVAPQPAFVVTAKDPFTSNRIALSFQFPLAFSPDPLTIVFWQNPTEFSMGRGEIDSHPLGAAVAPDAPAPIPEPASLALFGTALAGLGLIGRRRKRGSS